jgi:hypothetical protein
VLLRLAGCLIVAVVMAYVLGAHAAVAAQLTATWVDNSRGLASFELQRKAKGDVTYRTIADLPPRTISYVDRAIVEGVPYCYRVRAFNAFGDSPFSAEACGAAKVTSYSVSVRKTGMGSGLVGTTTGEILCGERCASTFPTGEMLTLFAAPHKGSRFVGWSGGCSGVGFCVVAGNAAMTLTARFEPL